MAGTEGVSLGKARAKRWTAKAVLVILEDRDDEEKWIPISQIHDDSELYDTDNSVGRLVVNKWFADMNGLTE